MRGRGQTDACHRFDTFTSVKCRVFPLCLVLSISDGWMGRQIGLSPWRERGMPEAEASLCALLFADGHISTPYPRIHLSFITLVSRCEYSIFHF